MLTEEIKLSYNYVMLHIPLYNGQKYLENKYPTWNIKRTILIHGHATDFDGMILKVWYELKPEDQLFRERFNALIKSIPTLEPLIKEVEYGCCPECGNYIKDWKSVHGSFAPEWWATMREKGIDPATGHSASCTEKQIRR